jgi:surface-anchored protein
MKNQTWKTALAAALLVASLSMAQSQTVLSTGHIDLGVGFEDGALHMGLHDEENEVEYAPDEAILQVGLAARQTVPPDPRFAFLGAAGASVYILPQVPRPDLLALGVGAEEIAEGLFDEDQLTLSLRGVIGPGRFALYSLDPFGNPAVHMSSHDGVDETDRLRVRVGAHGDFNWAFTAPGDYTISLEALGSLVDGGPVTSGPVDFSFHVIPEPATWMLVVLGLGACLGGTRARKNWRKVLCP